MLPNSLLSKKGERIMALAQNAYVDASNVFESSLESDYKKDKGIFYTDLSLAEKMLCELKPVKDAIIMDPCCGSGVFLYAAKKHGYINLFGIDQDKNAIKFCLNNINNVSFTAFDSIGKTAAEILGEIELSRQPDVIIGNPPYVPLAGDVELECDCLFRRKVSDSGNNLFVAALMRSLELVRKDGLVSYIIPKNFLHVSGYSLLRRSILEEKTIVSIVDLGAYFKNVRGEQIVLTLKNSTADKSHKIKLKKLSSNRFVTMCSIPQSFYSDEILIFNCSEDFSIYKKLTSSYQSMSDLCNGYVGRGKSTADTAINGKEIRKFGYKNHSVPTTGNKVFIQNIYSAEAGIIAAFGGNMEATQTVTVFTDGDEKMCRYILGILHSRICNLFLYKYCYNYSKLTMHTDAKYLKKIPLPAIKPDCFNSIISIVKRLECNDYLSQEWFNNLEELNQIVYKAYGITTKESDYIDSEMKRIQSKRWISDGQF